MLDKETLREFGFVSMTEDVYGLFVVRPNYGSPDGSFVRLGVMVSLFRGIPQVMTIYNSRLGNFNLPMPGVRTVVDLNDVVNFMFDAPESGFWTTEAELLSSGYVRTGGIENSYCYGSQLPHISPRIVVTIHENCMTVVAFAIHFDLDSKLQAVSIPFCGINTTEKLRILEKLLTN